MPYSQHLLKRASYSQLVDEAKWIMFQLHPGDPEHKEAEINLKMAIERLKETRKAGLK